jgi:hypothetical protein
VIVTLNFHVVRIQKGLCIGNYLGWKTVCCYRRHLNVSNLKKKRKLQASRDMERWKSFDRRTLLTISRRQENASRYCTILVVANDFRRRKAETSVSGP